VTINALIGSLARRFYQRVMTLSAELIHTIKLVRRLHTINAISVETNPDDLGKDGVMLLRDAGVNRLSVGGAKFRRYLVARDAPH
jgi:coproporphyrinogen III oxidase-like Fe-S oxidoreductase